VAVYVSAASRLHALLTALMQEPAPQTLRHGWSKVLGIPEPEVQYGKFGLSLVATLVSNAAEDAVRAEAQVGLPLRDALVQEWSKPVYAPGANLDGHIDHQQVSPEALSYLESVASVLRMAENHPALPTGDELTDLLEQVTELADSVDASTELTDDVKQALLRRIAQVRFAIENARIGGQEGVQEAVELLLGAAVVRARAVPRWTASKIFAVAMTTWALFAAGPTVQASLEAWPQVFETLTPGTGEMRGTGDADEQQDEEEPPPDTADC
jgi:hypothetical protein